MTSTSENSGITSRSDGKTFSRPLLDFFSYMKS